ncbi:MAG: Mov34/MPN/PAD-1 family protein [Deltaproteobacteria bacterium]|nr:Mov34/MPN/PAD-1 family protein [Deltaproteobacteria bacterium]
MNVSVFGLKLDADVIAGMIAHAEREYPAEACGLILCRGEGQPEITDRELKLVPLKNVQDRYHALDPKTFPRTANDAFRLDALEHARVLEAAARDGWVERILYHSHSDSGAYFSPEDRAMAVQGGVGMIPGIIHLVLSIRQGRCAAMAAFRFDDARQHFDEEHVSIPGEHPSDGAVLPDLELRGMDTRVVELIRPVGGLLVTRRLTLSESKTLPALAEGRQVVVRDPSVLRDIALLAGGYYSPLSGFLRSAEVRSVENRGRLPSGTPWRRAIQLTVKNTDLAPSIVSGCVVELVGPDGDGCALLAVAEVTPHERTTVLGGPVYVYAREGRDTLLDGLPAVDAFEQRAELLRRSARQVLAVPKCLQAELEHADVSEFDVVLSEESDGAGKDANGRSVLPLVGHEDAWLTAAMAQNQGATHIWVTDTALKARILDTLEIRPWRSAVQGAS